MRKLVTKRYREAHPEKVAGWKARYHEAHSERLNAINSDYYRDNTEMMKEAAKRYFEEHPTWYKWKKVNMSARKRKACGNVTLDEFVPLWEGRGDTCPSCHRLYGEGKLTPSVDHIQPLERGGLHTIENLQIMCCGCNRNKGF